MTTASPPIGAADLHGLVDGHLELHRRADLLRRLAKSPAERARVEAWQDQTDMLRAAFGGIDREPLPALLDLSPKPRLRCVSNEVAPRAEVHAGKSASRRRGVGSGIILALVAMSCFGWYLMSASSAVAPLADRWVSGSLDEALRARTIAALAGTSKARGGLPTLTIPDLETAGFTFVGAETHSLQPSSLLFRYRNIASETLVISVARGSAAPFQPPIRTGDVYLWRSRDNTFAMAGTIEPNRLKAIATVLQSDDLQ